MRSEDCLVERCRNLRGADTFHLVASELVMRQGVQDAERAVARVYVANRAGQLLFSSFMVASDRRRFARPRLQWLLFGAVAGESAWVAQRLLRKGTYQDRLALWVDSAFAAVGLVVCQAGLGSGDGALWMKNLAIGAAHGASSSDESLERVAAMGLLGSAAVWCGVHARGREARVAGLTLAVNDVINWTGQHVAARTYVSAHRRYAVLAEEARAIAVARAREAAVEKERSRQHQLLHATTVEVLRELALSTDEEAAPRLARREAARLRHVLRTQGRDRSCLDAGLEEVADRVDARGLAVELVTSELDADLASDAIKVTQNAVQLSLLAALEFDGARRATVRAVNDTTTVTITVRHQGRGFEPGKHSDYEQRLDALDVMLADIDGTADVWSSPGRGARVTLRLSYPSVSIVEHALDQPADGLPQRRVGTASTGDEDAADVDADIDRGSIRRVLVAAQDKIRGPRLVDDLESGAPRESFQARMQQGSLGDDPGPWAKFHTYRMISRSHGVVVRSAPFRQDRQDAPGTPSDEDVRAGRAILSSFLAYRFSGLATGLAAVVAGRTRYRAPRTAVSQLIAAAIESTWMAKRLWRSGGTDRAAASVDAAAAIAIVAAVRANIASEDRWTYLNWAPWSFAAPAVTLQAMTAAPHSTVAPLRAAAVGAAASASLSEGPRQFMSIMGGMGGLFFGSQMLARQIRRGSRRLQAAQARAVEEGTRLATEQERSRQLRLLHDSALQTLEAVGSRRYDDLNMIRSVALEEAGRLQRELDGTSTAMAPFASEIERIVRMHINSGLEVHLDVSDVREPPRPVAAALRDACSEALTNVSKHAGVTRASVRIESSRHGVSITVHDAGMGFDPARNAGFGTTESIQRRLVEVGGRAEIHSEPGRGTRVALWGPA